eukprot:jgi/Mesvir1/3723/Mv15001-RA.1
MVGRKRTREATEISTSSVKKGVSSSKTSKSTTSKSRVQLLRTAKKSQKTAPSKKPGESAKQSGKVANVRRSARLATGNGMLYGDAEGNAAVVDAIELPRKRKISRAPAPPALPHPEGARVGTGACISGDVPAPRADVLSRDDAETNHGVEASVENCGAAREEEHEHANTRAEAAVDPKEREWRRQARLAGAAFRLTSDPISSGVTPTCVHGRANQLRAMMDFCDRHVEEGTPGGMYLSGLPGTGKSLCVDRLLAHARAKGKSKLTCVFLNCVAQVPEAKLVYAKLLEAIQGGCPPKDPAACLAELRDALSWPSRKTAKGGKSKAATPLM